MGTVAVGWMCNLPVTLWFLGGKHKYAPPHTRTHIHEHVRTHSHIHTHILARAVYRRAPRHGLSRFLAGSTSSFVQFQTG